METSKTIVLPQPIIWLAHRHDDIPQFRLWFTVSTVVASIVLNMGIFVALVCTHMFLDVIKYRTKHHLAWQWATTETLRESLVDIFFIALGLSLALTIHHSIAIGGLGRLAELESFLIAMMLRTLPRLKIAEHLLEVTMYWKHHFVKQAEPCSPLSFSEKMLFGSTLAFALGFLCAPLFTSVSFATMLHTLIFELTPRLEISLFQTIEGLVQ